MDAADWTRVETAVLAETGTLADGTVDGVGIVGWQMLLDLLRERAWPVEFRVDGTSQPLPPNAQDLFLDDAFGIIAVWLTPAVRINVFPYAEDEICFDFDTRTLAGGGLQIVGEFSCVLGLSLRRPVKLAHEGDGTSYFLVYDPSTDTFEALI